ncbi:MAG: hypothetical protein HRT88_09905 [Lentisphaeraceae bacterium]|nr:hypothetical protein [Lentisphaeraceae bacterium]
MKNLLLFFLVSQIVLLASAEKKVLDSSWYSIPSYSGYTYPGNSPWQAASFEDHLINPTFKSTIPTLKNFHAPSYALPSSYTIEIKPPTAGIVRRVNRAINDSVEILEQEAYDTDNVIDYLIPLENTQQFEKKLKNDNYLVRFSSKVDTLIELIINNKTIAYDKGSLTVSAANFPDHGQAVIRCSSYKKNNKGLLSIDIYKVFEKVMPDPYHIAIDEKWYKSNKAGKSSIDGIPSTKWLVPSSRTAQSLSKLPENTPALYRRIYHCDKEGSAKNLVYSINEGIQHLWINGIEINLNDKRLPANTMKVGDNEIIYYSNKFLTGLQNNLTFYQTRPYWIRTTIKASTSSVLTAFTRGAQAKVYINNKY